MSPQLQRFERHQRLRELLARRAAIQREIRLLDQKIAVMSSYATQLRRLA